MRWSFLLLMMPVWGCDAESPKGGKSSDKAPDFSLEDVNPSSATFGASISPRDKEGSVSVWYFGHSDCPVCSTYFGELDVMQQRLIDEGYDIDIIGINGIDKEEQNDEITEGRDLPWLQDTAEDDVWTNWLAERRDLVVLDPDNNLAWRQNLTGFDITVEANANYIFDEIVAVE